MCVCVCAAHRLGLHLNSTLPLYCYESLVDVIFFSLAFHLHAFTLLALFMFTCLLFFSLLIHCTHWSFRLLNLPYAPWSWPIDEYSRVLHENQFILPQVDFASSSSSCSVFLLFLLPLLSLSLVLFLSFTQIDMTFFSSRWPH